MMIAQPQLLQIALTPKDVVYTPEWVARDMVKFFEPTGRILDPCKGDGVFLRYLPPHTEWCEVEEGKDFFAWYEPMDWIIGNPPYKIFASWLQHSMEIAQNIAYLLPCNKAFNSMKLLKTLQEWGQVRYMRVYGGGAQLNFPIGFAIGALLFQKDYHGPMYTTYYERPNV